MMQKQKNRDLDKILAELQVKEIPGEYISVGIIRTIDGREFEVDGHIVQTLFKDRNQFTEEDEDVVEEILEFLDHDRAEIDIVVNVTKLRDEITEKVNDLIETYLRK